MPILPLMAEISLVPAASEIDPSCWPLKLPNPLNQLPNDVDWVTGSACATPDSATTRQVAKAQSNFFTAMLLVECSCINLCNRRANAERMINQRVVQPDCQLS